MNDAVKKSAAKVEETLRLSGDFRKIDNHLFVIRQGSAYVMISVAPWGEERALVRFVAQVIVGVRLSPELAVDLLRRNASLRFGAFAFFQREQVIAITHTLLGGKTLDGDEILAAARDLALLADGVDEELMIAHGGRRMQDLIEEESIKSIAEELHTEPRAAAPATVAKAEPSKKTVPKKEPVKKPAPAATAKKAPAAKPATAAAAKKEAAKPAPSKKAAPAKPATAKKAPVAKPATAKKAAPKAKK